MEQLQEIAAALQRVKTAALFTHVNPDGDALGSTFALGRILTAMGKMVDIFFEQEIPEKFGYLAGSYRTDVPAAGAYDVGVCLDCGDAGRLGRFADAFAAMPLRISMDHHVSNGGFSDLDYTVPEAAATGELVYALSKLLVPSLDTDTQKCLFTAISTDTGNFKFSNVTANTFRMAAELMEMGLHIREVTKVLYDTVKLSKLRFTGAVADRIEMYQDGKLAVLVAPDSFLAAYELRHEDVEELPSLPLSVEGVLVSVTVKDDTHDRAKKKYSLRGKEAADLSEVARAFGGGGHKNAAGFVSALPVADVIAEINRMVRL